MSTTEYRQPTHREELERVLLSGASAQIAHNPENAAAIAKGIKTVLDELAPVAPHPVALTAPPVSVLTPFASRIGQGGLNVQARDTQAAAALSSNSQRCPDTLNLPVIDQGHNSLERCIQNHSDERAAKTGMDLAAHDVVTGLALRGLKEVDSLEREIQAKADKGPRVTPAALKDEIVSEHYFTAADGCSGACNMRVRQDSWVAPLNLLTFCVLVLRNGFTVHGVSACASPENYNKEIGERIARENAEREIRPLLGFRLRDELARPVLTEADALADLAGEPRPS